MVRLIVSAVVVALVAGAEARWLLRVPRTPSGRWFEDERRLVLVAFGLVVLGAVAMGGIHSVAIGVGALLLWGVLAVFVMGVVRLSDDEGELEQESRWLLDVTVLVTVAVTVFFAVLDFGTVFLPSTFFVVAAWRMTELHRGPRTQHALPE